METIGSRVKAEREKRGWSQARLAEEVNKIAAGRLPRPVLQQHINQLEGPGGTRIPRYLVYLAKALGKSATELQDGRSGNVSEPIDPIIHVPLISWVKATTFTEICDPYEPGDSEGEVLVPYAKQTLIALKVDGNSMNRVAPDGAIIIIDYSDKSLVSGKYYVIKYDNKGTFKRYRSNPDRFEPESTELHDTIFPDGDLEVVGRVVKVLNDL